MNVTTKSWHARFWMWYKNVPDYHLPESGCTYGRGLIFMMLSMLVLWFPLLPYWVMKLCGFDKEGNEDNRKDQSEIGWILWLLIVLFSSPYFTYLFGFRLDNGGFSGESSHQNALLTYVSLICNFFLLLFLIFIAKEFYNDSEKAQRIVAKISVFFKSKKKQRVKKEKQPNVIIEYFKAIKNKACPKLNWVDRKPL